MKNTKEGQSINHDKNKNPTDIPATRKPEVTHQVRHKPCHKFPSDGKK